METAEIPTKTYTKSHKLYYEKNKEEILAKYKEAKPYKAFYQRNKERLKAKALERYYQKKIDGEQVTA
jgi:hypothetical protein